MFRPLKGHLQLFLVTRCYITGLQSEWSTSRPGRFTPRKKANGTHYIGGLLGITGRVDDMEKRKIACREPNPGLPAYKIKQ
jgi:hypothetical protein